MHDKTMSRKVTANSIAATTNMTAVPMAVDLITCQNTLNAFRMRCVPIGNQEDRAPNT
jgi:hypothetical protein